MLKIGNTEYDELKVAKVYWEKIKDFENECRKLATEYVKSDKRRKFYRLDYDYMDPVDKDSIYVPLTDQERDTLQKALAKKEAEDTDKYGPYEDERDRIESLENVYWENGIDWEGKIPFEILHTVVGDESIRITKIDFNDIKHYCRFSVHCYLPYFVAVDRDIDISDDEYIELLTDYLFFDIWELSIYQIFDPKLFEHIMKEINISPDLISHIHKIDLIIAANDIRKHHNIGDIPGIEHPYFTHIVDTIQENKDYLNCEQKLWEEITRQICMVFVEKNEYASIEEWENGKDPAPKYHIISGEELKGCEK